MPRTQVDAAMKIGRHSAAENDGRFLRGSATSLGWAWQPRAPALRGAGRVAGWPRRPRGQASGTVELAVGQRPEAGPYRGPSGVLKDWLIGDLPSAAMTADECGGRAFRFRLVVGRGKPRCCVSRLRKGTNHVYYLVDHQPTASRTASAVAAIPIVRTGAGCPPTWN